MVLCASYYTMLKGLLCLVVPHLIMLRLINDFRCWQIKPSSHLMVLYADDRCLNQLFHLGLQNCYFLILSFLKSHTSPLILHVAGQIFFPDSDRKLELCSLERVKQGFYWLGWCQLQSRVCMGNRLKIVFEWMFACRMLRPSTLSQPHDSKRLGDIFLRNLISPRENI